MEYNTYCNLLEHYCLSNKLDEGVLSGLSGLSDAVLGVFKNIGEQIRKLAAKLGVQILDIVNALKQKDIFGFLRTIGFNFQKLLDYMKQAYNAIKSGIDAVFKELSKSDVIQKIKSGVIKVDDLLNKYPVLKKLTGPVLTGLMIYMWINSTFTGDVGDDFDISHILQALNGKFTINDLFLSPEGLKFLAFYSTGALFSFPYIFGTFPMVLVVALVLTGYKKLKKDPKIIQKLQSNIKGMLTEEHLRSEIRSILNELNHSSPQTL